MALYGADSGRLSEFVSIVARNSVCARKIAAVRVWGSFVASSDLLEEDKSKESKRFSKLLAIYLRREPRFDLPTMPKLLQITFRKPGADDNNPNKVDAQSAVLQRAHKIADVPGLLWKIWIARPSEKIYGGTYLFVDAASAQAYLDSPIPDDIRGMPEFTTQLFDVEAGFSQITHAPLERPTKPR